MAGFTTSFGAIGEDIYVVKTDLEGNLIWERTYGGNGDDNAWSIKRTTDNNYVIAGFSNSFSDGDWDIYLIKIDDDGNQIWDKNIPAPKDQFAWSILADASGEYVIVGQTNNTIDEKETSYCLKLNEHGETVWSYQPDRQEVSRAFGVLAVGNSYFISGMVDTDTTNLDGFITRLTQTGDEMWTKTYGGQQDDIGHAINETPDGNIIISGYSKSYGTGNSSPWILKVDLNGDQIWNNTFGTFLEERIVSSIVAQNGETTLLGYVFKASGVDLLLIQVDPKGQLLWMKTFGSPENEEAGQTIVKNENNQIVYSGRTYQSDKTKGDLFLMIDSLGN